VETAENSTQQPEAVKVAFNPFTVLSVTEIVALAGTYTKAWKSAHIVDTSLAMSEFGCSEEEACFYADLKGKAAGIIDRDTVRTIGDKIAGLVRGIGTPSREISLNLIKMDYESVKVELRAEVGKRVRESVLDVYETATGDRLLQILYTHLGVREKDWMRK
jgi:hypothetical protein